MSHLIVVPCHASLKEAASKTETNLMHEVHWSLQDFQRGEVTFYAEHVQRAVEEAAKDPSCYLIFSGGYTRKESGKKWSEAKSYLAIAEFFGWWGHTEVAKRVLLEEYARDSFENLLFSICKMVEQTGNFPDKITVVGWSFKAERFKQHSGAIGFPKEQFHYIGVNNPFDLEKALVGEHKALNAFATDRYGAGVELSRKRAARNHLGLQHPYHAGPLADLLAFIEKPENSRKTYPGNLPW